MTWLAFAMRCMRLVSVIALCSIVFNDTLADFAKAEPVTPLGMPEWLAIILAVLWLTNAFAIIWLGARELEEWALS
jgi:hypothetical protein